MGQALLRCLDEGGLPERDRHEFVGRLSYIMLPLRHDLLSIRRLAVFAAKGAALVAAFEGVFDQLYASASAIVVETDLSNQDYTFSYSRFANLNPLCGARV